MKTGNRELQLLERHQWNKVDWETLAKNEEKEMNFLQSIVVEILALHDRSEHAQAIIRKYNIQRNEPAQPK